jgi:hypothetical protein
MKLKTNNFFIGKVLSVTDEDVVFEVITSSGIAKNKVAGDKIELKRQEESSCGRKDFSAGEVWLYDGNDISFGPSQKLEPADIKDGYALEAVKNKLIHRVEPDYIPPKPPEKNDLPIPGTYSHSEECDEGDKANGYMSADYTLEISQMNTVTKNYKVDVLMNICRGGHICSFSAEAPAYGYGEIILPVVDEDGNVVSECNVIVQQLSGVDEWPRLGTGEAKVRMDDYKCQKYLTCGANTYLNSPVLQKE